MREILKLLLQMLLVFPTIQVLAQSAQISVTHFRPYALPRLVVPVMINGTGPYEFLLDTGASKTLIDAALVGKLGLPRVGGRQLVSVAGVRTEDVVSLVTMSLGSQDVDDLRVIAVKDLHTSSIGACIRGLLGEDFLSHFDVLIGNKRGYVTLDRGPTLVNSVQGERLQLERSGFENLFPNETRLFVLATLPRFDKSPKKLLLDSGADALLVLATNTKAANAPRHLSPNVRQLDVVNGSLQCTSSLDALHLRTFFMQDVEMVQCDGATAANTDHDGSIPTRIFKRIFISHNSHYIILNPTLEGAP